MFVRSLVSKAFKLHTCIVGSKYVPSGREGETRHDDTFIDSLQIIT